jgi:hypothetical protein
MHELNEILELLETGATAKPLEGARPIWVEKSIPCSNSEISLFEPNIFRCFGETDSLFHSHREFSNNQLK